jgi:hypothetical protein
MTHRMNIRFTIAAALLALAAVSTGCGSGGGGTTASDAGAAPAVVSEAVEWAPPTTYFDNTPLDPQTDLSHYDIYIGTSPTFTDNDAPVAAVAAVTTESAPDGKKLGQKATTSFNLTHLAPFVEQGKVYYVSVRAVGTDNLVSSFSTAVEWDLG